jgi:hypothetical protein
VAIIADKLLVVTVAKGVVVAIFALWVVQCASHLEDYSSENDE